MTHGSALTVLAFAASSTPHFAQLDAIREANARPRPRSSLKPAERAERNRKAKAAKASRKRNR